MSESNNIEHLDSQITHLEGRVEAATNPSQVEEKPNLFAHDSDTKLTSELGAIYDKAEAREERKPVMPPKEGERLGDRVERVAEWMDLSAAEKKLQSDAAK